MEDKRKDVSDTEYIKLRKTVKKKDLILASLFLESLITPNRQQCFSIEFF